MGLRKPVREQPFGSLRYPSILQITMIYIILIYSGVQVNLRWTREQFYNLKEKEKKKGCYARPEVDPDPSGMITFLWLLVDRFVGGCVVLRVSIPQFNNAVLHVHGRGGTEVTLTGRGWLTIYVTVGSFVDLN